MVFKAPAVAAGRADRFRRWLCVVLATVLTRFTLIGGSGPSNEEETIMPRSFVPPIRTSDALPFVEMNTTPLIDVLLVLLVMLIVTIPMQSHVVKIDLPQGPARVTVQLVRDDIVVTRTGAIEWNGAPVSRAELAEALRQVAAMATPPEVHLRPDAQARYETVDEVLAIAKRAQVRTLGFVGNERYAAF